MAPTRTTSRPSERNTPISRPKATTAVNPQRAVTSVGTKTKSSRPSKQIFAGKTMSFAGDFTEDRKEWKYDAMVRWIKNHGALYVSEVNDETTHLICTIKEYKAKTKQVRKAWELGRRCHIVVADWLEDCLIGPKGSVRCRVEKPYTLNRVLARIQKGKSAQVKFRHDFEDGVKRSQELVDNRLNYVYRDEQDGFEYKIVLTRVNLGGRIISEKYTIYLFASIAKPHTFMCGAKFSRSHRRATYYREETHPKFFFAAFQDFRRLFEQKTQIPWDDRLEGIKKGPEAFVYTPPKLGRPVGMLPPGYVRPELRVEENSSEGASSEGEDLVYDTDSEADSDDETGENSISSSEHGDASASSGDTRSPSPTRSLEQEGSAGSSTQDSAGSSTQPIVLSDGE